MAEIERRRPDLSLVNLETAITARGTPLLGDHLEEGLSKLDLSCADIDFGHWPTLQQGT